MNDRCIIFYHGNDWDWVPARQRYLMEALSHYLPVIYLDGGRDKRGKVTYHKVAENVLVVRGLISIVNSLHLRGMTKLARLSGHWYLHWARKKYGRLLFWQMENGDRPYRFMPHDILIFDSIDPVFDQNPEVVKEFECREIGMLQAADKVFASADSLVEFCSRHHSDVTLLNNACEPSEYAPDLLASASQPLWWPVTQQPVAAYLGSIDARFDFDYALRAVFDHPSIQFVFAGNVNPAFQDRVKELHAAPNVVCPGRISVEDGRYLLSRCTMGLIPFTLGKMNDAINPVKMYAYALLGKPVVGTATREMVKRPEIVLSGEDAISFSKRIPEAIELAQDEQVRDRLVSFALQNTWKARATQAWTEIKDL